jgi:hypothetical protein
MQIIFKMKKFLFDNNFNVKIYIKNLLLFRIEFYLKIN